jgi:hypothetical protein
MQEQEVIGDLVGLAWVDQQKGHMFAKVLD